MNRHTLALAAALSLLAGAARAQSSLPDPRITPGAVNPDVTATNVASTICRLGWTKTIRPPESYTRSLKRLGIREYGYTDRRLRSYQEDHLIPLELGGSPRDPRNLWPEPWTPPDGWGAKLKDNLENKLNFLVCTGRVPLAEAQQAFARNWEDAYNRYENGE
jgi:hypothetical protein